MCCVSRKYWKLISTVLFKKQIWKHHLWLRDILTDAPANSDGKTGYSGPALFARSPFIASGSEYYYMPQNGIQLERESEFYSETNAHGIVWATVEKGDEQYTLVTTHFTWSEDGRATEKQKCDFEYLKKILDTLPPHILTGDLNAPRGFGIWEKFVAYYGRDYIPQGITSTIDPNLHRVKISSWWWMAYLLTRCIMSMK